MSKARLLWHNYRYFPYERELARREVEAVLGQKPEETEDCLIVPINFDERTLIDRLTYFKGAEIPPGLLIPDQARLEASASGNNQAWLSDQLSFPSLRRQSTRYSAHGLHEYRGKFNPQIVRAIGNLIGLKPDDWVLDPFCGSGTTLLEAAHIGWNAIGFDVNPLGVMIASAKVAAFKCSPKTFTEAATRLITCLQNTTDKVEDDWRNLLPNSEYLAVWFTEPVLEQFAIILKEIERVPQEDLRTVFRVVLSDICRDVSLQDPGDLRIRRRKEPYPEFRPIKDFCEALIARVGTICRAREHVELRNSVQFTIHGDSRFSNVQATHFLRERNRDRVDAAITSPPYATALPYIDTQRLSLCLLGLIPASTIRATERELIGNREIANAERVALEKSLLNNEANLPKEVWNFCRSLLTAADCDEHGFRRRNVPALAYKYFAQMGETFTAVGNMVRQNGFYALVVGGNKTNLQGEEILIDTPVLLAEVAQSRGWTVVEKFPLNTYQRYDVHMKNSIHVETLLILRNNDSG